MRACVTGRARDGRGHTAASSVAKTRKAGVVDSYAAIKAAQHAVKMRPPPARPVAVAVSGEPPDLKALGAAISHTAVPVKHVIECHECGYKFQLHGRASTTNCSKCRATLDLADHIIENRWSGSLKTAGKIRITSDGVVEAGSLVGSDIILEGTIKAAIVRAIRRLELHAGARFSEPNVVAADLLIAPGATIAFVEPAEFRDVEIAGTLRANLHATGLVTIRAGGCFKGEVHCPRLVVDDGGGLQANVRLVLPA